MCVLPVVYGLWASMRLRHQTCCCGLVQLVFCHPLVTWQAVLCHCYRRTFSRIFHDPGDVSLTRCVGHFPRTFHRLPVLEGEEGSLARARHFGARNFLFFFSCDSTLALPFEKKKTSSTSPVSRVMEVKTKLVKLIHRSECRISCWTCPCHVQTKNHVDECLLPPHGIR